MDSKKHILTAASTLFAHKGYAAASIREIARVAGVNVAMVHYYFKSKEYLLLHVLNDGVKTVREEMERILEADQRPIEKLYSIVDAYGKHIFINKEVALLFFREQMNRSSKIVSEQLLQFAQWSQHIFMNIVKEGQKNDLFSKDANAAMLYATLLGTCQQVLVQTMPLPAGQEREAVVNYLKSVISKMLR
jgi:AcrR family transcriptional regulator